MSALISEGLLTELLLLVKSHYCTRLVRGLLRQDLPAEVIRDVRHALALCRFRGYRPGRRPEGQMLKRVLVSELPARSRTLTRFLHIWSKAYPDRVERVKEALSSHASAQGVATSSGPTPAAQQAGAIARELGLPLEDVVITMASIAITTGFDPKGDATHDLEEKEEANMPRGEDESTPEGVAISQLVPSSVQPATPARVEAPDRWSALLADLEQLPANSEEWGRVEAFLQRAAEISRRKTEERAQRRPVAELLSQLLQFRDDFAFFEMDPAEQWSTAHVEFGNLAVALAHLSRLVEDLGKFRALRQQQGSTWKEEQRLRATERKTGEGIISTFAELSAIFAPADRASYPGSDVRQEGQEEATLESPPPPGVEDITAPTAHTTVRQPPVRSEAEGSLCPEPPTTPSAGPAGRVPSASVEAAAVPVTTASPLQVTTPMSWQDPAATPRSSLEPPAPALGEDAGQPPVSLEEEEAPVVEASPLEIAMLPASEGSAAMPKSGFESPASALGEGPSDDAALDTDRHDLGDGDAIGVPTPARIGAPVYSSSPAAPSSVPSAQTAPRPASGDFHVSSATPLEIMLGTTPLSPAKLAKTICDLGADVPAIAFSRLVWELMRAERISIAYHLQRCLEDHGVAADDAPSSAAIRAFALSRAVHTSYGDIVDELRDTIRDLSGDLVPLVDNDSSSRIPETLILYGLCLRPALLAPGTGAPSLFEQLDLHGALSGLNALRSAITRFGRLNFELTPSILKGVRAHAAWEAQINNHIGKCEAWRERVRRAQILYAPATHVWWRWLEPGGQLASLLDIVAEDRRNSTSELRRALALWSSAQHIDQEANKTDRDIRPDARKKPIEARARERLQSHAREAVSLMQEWLDLVESGPLQNADPRSVLANERRLETLPTIDEADHAILGLLDGPRSAARAPLEIAGGCARAAIADLRRLFDPDTAPPVEARRREILNQELLAIPGITLDAEWNPPRDAYASNGMLDGLLAHVQRGPLSWRVAFQEQCEHGNHEATGRILDMLERYGAAEVDLSLSDLRRIQEKNISERRSRMNQTLAGTKAAFERAIAEDLFAESEILGLQDTINQTRADDVLDFATVERRIADVRARIDARRQQRIDEVRARLKEHAGSAHLDTIEHALANGNLLAANEYIAMIERGEAIHPIKPDRDSFLEFFPDKVQSIQQLLERQGISKRDVARAIGRGESVGPLEMSSGLISGEQAEEARAMLLAWIQAGQYGGSDPGGHVSSALVDVFKGLGFRNVQLTPTEGQVSERVRSYNMQSEVIREALTCIIPQYGSLASGRYRILCMWRGPSEEELVELAGSAQHHDRPIIVVYFGRMSTSRRRSLAVLCRQRRRTFLLLDETLLFFLSVQRGLRLAALFACTFPFTVVDPYTTTAGLVPAEMFFGRGQERRAVFEPTGTNLVYGGRQLGKTALLRDVERRYHAPGKGIIVRWIDLKAEGIGLNRPIHDLWVVIVNVLHREGVLSRTDYGAELFSIRVAEWLEKDAGRRIVLLLDEADAFLKSDAETREDSTREAFSNLWRLKGIMDKTSRRFKIVFAGLHNVQRTSRDVNSPLAHLGAPICIGPLLENGEWQEARRLITMPFTQLGYRFASDDLPMRILAHANWYPSLIQLFCKYLLEHLTHPNRASFSANDCPPYTITAQHIEEAYQSQELRKAIVDRFRWTLDLDPRYRVVALCILFESATQRDGFITGFSVQRLRELALYWWEAGFKSTTTIEGFRTILDEMIGLGLLRRAGGANYALRSPNVVNLFGKKDEIELALLDASQHQPPPEYDAATFRRALPQSHKRSPFTAQQESELLAQVHGVSMVFGAVPSGLDDAVGALSQASSAQNIGINVNWQQVGTAAQFRAVLGERTEKRDEGLSVLVVPTTVPWTVEWVVEAASKLSNLKSPKKFVRVIFLADPQKTWTWVQREEADRARLNDASVADVILGPWHDSAVHRWLIDVELGSGGVDSGRFKNATGSWGALLHEVARRCDKNNHQWERHLEDFEKELTSTSTWLDLFEVQPTPMPVLKVLADMEAALDLDELCALCTGLDRREVERSMEWAELLAYVRLVGVRQWTIDPLLGRLLARSPA